jgi:hypothetical protein
MGVGLIIGGIFMAYRARQTLRWPAANGVVTGGEIKHIYTKNGGNSYKPIVRYKYEVNNSSFSGDRLRLFSGTHLFPEKVLEEYPKGIRVTVYYDPKDAAKSVLLPGVGGSLGAIGGMFFGGIALVVIIGFIMINGNPLL